MALLRTYPCTNPGCSYSIHYSPVCPYPRGPRRPLLESEKRAFAEYSRLLRAGDFDLRRTPSYMRDREQARRENAKPGPGWGWLLVLAPVAVLLTVVMLALVLVA